MKRSSIKAGDVLYWQEIGDWRRDTTYGHARVTVVDVRPHHRSGTGALVPGNPYRRESYNLLVSEERPVAGKPGKFYPAERTLVRVADLHGPYDETLTAVKAREEDKRDQAVKARDQRAAVKEAVQAVIDRAKQAGVTNAHDDTMHAYNDRLGFARVSMSLADLTHLLDQLDDARRAIRKTNHLYTCGCANPGGPQCQQA